MGAQAAKPDPDTPSDLNIPDNYVAQTLQNTKPLPSITLRNLHKELNYLTCALLLLNPILGLVGASRTSLQWKTAVWAVIYYFITGLGTFLLFSLHKLVSNISYRDHSRIPSSMGTSLLQC